MTVLKWIGGALAALAAVAALAYLFRTDPIYMIAGKRLSGEEQPYPPDWSACNQHPSIAVETRPEDPHSVTTLCFVLDGDLIIPAEAGSTKEWTANVVADPRIRLKLGDAIYPALAERDMALTIADVAPAAQAKYPQMAERRGDEPAEDVWLFRVRPR